MAAYLENRSAAGARASTLKVTAAAVAHKDAGFDVPPQYGVAKSVLDVLTTGRLSRSHQGAVPVAQYHGTIDTRSMERHLFETWSREAESI